MKQLLFSTHGRKEKIFLVLLTSAVLYDVGMQLNTVSTSQGYMNTSRCHSRQMSAHNLWFLLHKKF